MSGYYNESGNKFLAFLLPTTIYRRLILLDADCLILRAPHHLFELPDEIPYAAPKAYWYWKKRKFQDSAFWKVRSLRRSRQDFLTSWFMTIRPSTSTFERLRRKLYELIEQGIKDVYDMDLFNIALGEDVTALPPVYGMLDFEFSENDNTEMGATLDEIINGEKAQVIFVVLLSH
ncbi:hypothetical protein NSK_005869 [Nannochloropsis salina CCMP1776]|uniref:Nucleotide-diphospho-sugar transferase domain-containing protein n=1 Tax=Nannochloropsis salina CCMP1776 TaxID=1027361 RepID=A0A4D9CYV2_9STRA|nr:hypothetical protein NSK_005869 [Nannochloropsis salina CCMP1776]|eukprot:TFJ82793.1 hypothetical protein NSK_005869 [Nannochloropsis salina CCMP1776]